MPSVRGHAILVFVLLVGLTPTLAVSGAQESIPTPSTAPPPWADARPQYEVLIPRGTEILLVTTMPLSSERNVKGDLIRMTVSNDVVVQGQVVIPRGSIAVGELTRAERKGAFGSSGKLEARMLYVTVDGAKYRIGGSVGVRGRSGTTGTVATALAVGTLAFVVTGKRAEIATGSPISAYVDRDVLVTSKRVQ